MQATLVLSPRRQVHRKAAYRVDRLDHQYGAHLRPTFGYRPTFSAARIYLKVRINFFADLCASEAVNAAMRSLTYRYRQLRSVSEWDRRLDGFVDCLFRLHEKQPERQRERTLNEYFKTTLLIRHSSSTLTSSAQWCFRSRKIISVISVLTVRVHFSSSCR